MAKYAPAAISDERFATCGECVAMMRDTSSAAKADPKTGIA